MLYRLVLCDMPEPPDAMSDTLLEGSRAAPPPGAGAVCVNGWAHLAFCRDAVLGLAMCAYMFCTTLFIVSFHMEQTRHGDAIAENKRVYVIARRPRVKRLPWSFALTFHGKRARSRRYAIATINLIVDALLLSPIAMLVRSVLLPALVAWLLRAPLAEAERSLFSAKATARACGFASFAPAAPSTGELVARPGRVGVDGSGIDLIDMNEASGKARGDAKVAVDMASSYGNGDASAWETGNPMRNLV